METMENANERAKARAKNAGSRQPHIDDVRSLVIFLVVLIHASVTYSGLGGWYIVENKPDSIDMATKALCGFFNSFNQAWFMGIMFFFGGYFAFEALSRKGPGSFLRDRLLRLGIPLAAYMLAFQPLIVYYVAYPQELRPMGSLFSLYFGRYLATGMFLDGSGPLWFAEALLAFCAILALAARQIPRLGKPASGGAKVPSTAKLLSVALFTAAFAFALRLFWPIGTDWMNLQFCFFASYIVLFVLGVLGARGGWFLELTSGARSRWLIAVFAIGVPAWACIMLFGGILTVSLDSMNGGLTWQSAAYALWESFTAIGMCVGLTAAFANRAGAKRRATLAEIDIPSPGALSRFLSRNSFSVYVFHPAVLIAITKLARGWALPTLAKALIVGLAAYAITIALAELVVRRVPGVRKYF
ncbi:MAG: hypothetical protein A2Z99_21670 [Treponema sp. GWB1_62_6]|nr:MAG: hypothetical protein A2Y36_10305 [Treponema sp. GWA1_62_8]OHE64729.1 MAG: hypothetical protein A2001_04230 [Treponema sp. GWC1_61_84]OHE67753.1 MAG: hypothetical protein A2Z99_21670 [Treponema sp. GWB1_62_6]OHE75636.1 MAG: hypothetical protein A2413_11225 [Treponema sp. RIFOXYC1_FULL_61_9]HCM27567.1 hypothetical protein [Treponema sp.]